MTAVSLHAAPGVTGSRARWIALTVVCAGSLMNVLDTTIVGRRPARHPA